MTTRRGLWEFLPAGKTVLIELTLEELAFTSLAMDRARLEGLLVGSKYEALVEKWDRAYVDSSSLLDQRVQFEDRRGCVRLVI